MSNFYGIIETDKSRVTRQSQRVITGNIQGWNTGVRTIGYIGNGGDVVFEVYQTGGSNDAMKPRLLCKLINGEEVNHAEDAGSR